MYQHADCILCYKYCHNNSVMNYYSDILTCKFAGSGSQRSRYKASLLSWMRWFIGTGWKDSHDKTAIMQRCYLPATKFLFRWFLPADRNSFNCSLIRLNMKCSWCWLILTDLSDSSLSLVSNLIKCALNLLYSTWIE